MSALYDQTMARQSPPRVEAGGDAQTLMSRTPDYSTLRATFDAVRANFPPRLLGKPNWITWRYEMVRGKLTKVPYNARGVQHASTTDARTWSSFDQACAGCLNNERDGIGYCFDGNETGVDLDKALDDAGAVKPWAQEIIASLDSYTEVSPSGEGLHAIMLATFDGTGRKVPYADGAIERYTRGRFFTVTGDHLPGTPEGVEARQEALDAFSAAYLPTKRPKATPAPSSKRTGPSLSDENLLTIARNAKDGAGADFAALYDHGDMSQYGDDHSRADFALCKALAFYTGKDTARIESLFAASALNDRDKWGRADYRERTISGAIEATGDTYSGKGGAAYAPEGRDEAEDEPAPALASVEDKILLAGAADDAGNAEAMYALYGRNYLFTPSYGWLEWARTHWREIPEQIVVQRVVSALKARRLAAVRADIEAVVKVTKADRARVAGCLMLFKSLVIEPDVGAFDANPDALNCKDGVLNLRTGELATHDQAQRFTYCLPIAWNRNADMTLWQQFILESLGGDQGVARYLQECAGYSLTGHTREEKAFYVHGPTRAGKGTYTETLLKLLPRPLSVEVDFSTFTAQRDGDSQNFDLAPLKPARLVVASESKRAQSLNAAKLKQLTGGNPIYCAFKHKDMFNYRPQFKVWLVSNWEVKADADDDAAWGRLQVFTFPHSHLGHEDTTLKSRLQSPAGLQGVLRWAVEGAMRWYGLERLTPPEAITAATAAHRGSQDYVRLWLDEHCTLDAEEFTSTAVLMASYTNWCELNNTRAHRVQEFSQTLIKRFGCKPASKNHNRIRGFLGIKLHLTPPPVDPDDHATLDSSATPEKSGNNAASSHIDGRGVAEGGREIGVFPRMRIEGKSPKIAPPSATLPPSARSEPAYFPDSGRVADEIRVAVCEQRGHKWSAPGPSGRIRCVNAGCDAVKDRTHRR